MNFSDIGSALETPHQVALQSRKSMIDVLKARIADMERGTVGARVGQSQVFEAQVLEVQASGSQTSGAQVPGGACDDVDLARAVSFGVAEIDGVLADGGLAHAALHEVRAGSYADAPAAQAFLLALIARRQRFEETRGTVMWCVARASGWDFGAPYGHGLAALGLDPANVIFVDPATQADALWVMEEAVRSRAVSAVVGVVGQASTVQARRLSLAAQEARCPCFIMEHHDAAPVLVAHTRWKIRRRASHSGPPERAIVRSPSHMPSSPASGDLVAPKWTVTLERSRHGRRGLGANGLSWNLEWCHATRGFDLVAPLADAASAPPPIVSGSADVIRLSA